MRARTELMQVAVHDGGTYIYLKMADLLKRQINEGDFTATSALHLLTGREIEITTLLARVLANKEVAEQLYLSVKTVEAHRSKIYAKLGIRARSELVDFVIKHKLLEL